MQWFGVNAIVRLICVKGIQVACKNFAVCVSNAIDLRGARAICTTVDIGMRSMCHETGPVFPSVAIAIRVRALTGACWEALGLCDTYLQR